MTTAVIVIAAVVLAALLLALLVLSRRPSKHADDHVADAVNEMRVRMDQLVGDLSAALSRAERESQRNRIVDELSGSIDLDEVLIRLVETVVRSTEFDAAMIALDQPGAPPLIVERGLSEEEAAQPPTSGALSGGSTRTVVVNYRYAPDEVPSEAELIRGGVFVPLVDRESVPLGTLTVFWRDERGEPTPEQIEQVEELARACVTPIENARRYREARQLAETDALTGLHNQRYFHDTLRREVARAQRYERRVALLVMDLDDFKSINDRIGHLAGDSVLAKAAERLREAVRATDVACRIGGDEFAVILPESAASDADQLFTRVRDSLSATSVGAAGRLRVSGGIAELRHGDTGASLFERADAALYRAKEIGKGEAVVADDLGEISTT
jgi:diguanylate cyclase (GGDEF)-like protein